MNSLLKQVNPNLVLTGTSTQNGTQDIIEQTITLAAQEKNIPSLSVLDVWMNYWERFSDIYQENKSEEDKTKKFKFLPTKIAIMDKYAKQEMLSEGFPEDKLVITGNPHFDNLEKKAQNFNEKQQDYILDQVKLNKGTFLFYAANVWEEYKKEYGFWDLDNIKLINKTIEALPTKHRERTGIITKLHPRTPQQDIEKISQYIKEKGENRISLVTNIDSQDIVLASDLTLTPNSTLAFEAIYLHKPSMSMQPGLRTKDYLSILTNNNLIPVGYTKQECQELISKAIINKDYRKELVKQASSFTTDGKATQRVTDLAYKMAEVISSPS